jgi:hypothetical protein
MTEFVESFSTQQLLPPWESKGCRTWSFAIEVPPSTVEAYVNDYLNVAFPDRAPCEYVPLPGPQFGLLTVGLRPDTFSTSSGKPPYRLSFNEVHWSFPVSRRWLNPVNRSDERPTVWLQPFLFCDNSTVVFSSREIWGADTVWARIFPDETLQPDDLRVNVVIDGIKAFSPRAHDEKLGCLHIRTGAGDLTSDRAAEPPEMRHFVEKAIEGGMIPPTRKVLKQKSNLLPVIERNNLKQFRDIQNMANATYRAIVATETTHSNVRDLVYYDCSEIIIEFMWSSSIAEMMTKLFAKVKPPDPKPAPEQQAASPNVQRADWNLGRVPLKALLGFSFRSDVSFKVQKNVHTYCN